MTGARLRGLVALKPTSEDLLHLDLMRFIASAGIVLCHSGEFFFDRSMRQASHDMLAGLSLFVDVFFIISGFVITHVYAGRMAGWREFARFMQRRIGRLFPLHLVTLLAVAMLFLAVEVLRVPTNTDMRLVPSCLVLGSLLLHSAIDCGGPVPNGVNWSISAEMVMYFAFPALLVLARRAGVLRYLAWAGLLAFVAARYPPGMHWATSTEFWRALPAFFFGMALRLDWRSWSRLPVPGWLPVLSGLLLIAGSFLLWPRWLLLGLAYLTALAAVIADGRGPASWFTRRFAPLGQLTYSIYMLHPLVIMIFVNALGDKLLKLDPVPLSVLTVASYALIGISALLSWKFFETPARRYIDALDLVPERREMRGGV